MNNYSKYEILVVDDVKNAAEDYANLIFAKTGIAVAWATDAARAEQIASHNEIKVLVLDQRMPVPGTELLTILRKHNPYSKALMITGEASKEEIGEAMNLGFNKYRAKEEIIKIVEDVRHLYVEYETDFSSRINNGALGKWHFFLKGIIPSKLYILSQQMINKEYVDEEKSQTINSILAGEEHTMTSEVSMVEELVVETAIENSLDIEGTTPIELIGSISSTIKKVLNIKKHLSIHKSRNESVKYRLPDDSDEISRRVVLCSPVYEVYRIAVAQKNFIWGKLRRSVVIVRKFTGKYQLKQIDYLKNNKTKETKLGIQEL